MSLKRCVLAFLIAASTTLAAKERSKLPPQLSKPIIAYTLFNYDNLIADHFEGKTDYLGPLAISLSQATGYPSSNMMTILTSPDVTTEIDAVKYMLKINAKLCDLTGLYFVDF